MKDRHYFDPTYIIAFAAAHSFGGLRPMVNRQHFISHRFNRFGFFGGYRLAWYCFSGNVLLANRKAQGANKHDC
jgi:hypothetical protein